MSGDERLKAQISAYGPLTIAQYMTWRLHDPQDGYYATQPALGEDGDFITAPLVSQMFGELLGLWAAEVWSRLGRPTQVILAEAGPGDGTLMTDVLRAARLEPAFLQAARLCLIETSPALRTVQAERLAAAPLTPQWRDSLEDLPQDAPVILLANELLDCLPARQFLRTPAGWAERMVGLDANDALTFGLAPCPPVATAPQAEPGQILEASAAQESFAATLAGRLVQQGGAALLVDYGRAEPGFGDTLQALKRHRKVSPLEAGADLTIHADFPAVAAAARGAGARTTPILTQALFLDRLGIHQRAHALAIARPDRAEIVQRQLARLTAPEHMGALFKVLGIYAPSLDILPGFEEP
jgi:SAM-dependent MidA family methyltransferase